MSQAAEPEQIDVVPAGRAALGVEEAGRRAGRRHDRRRHGELPARQAVERQRHRLAEHAMHGVARQLQRGLRWIAGQLRRDGARGRGHRTARVAHQEEGAIGDQRGARGLARGGGQLAPAAELAQPLPQPGERGEVAGRPLIHAGGGRGGAQELAGADLHRDPARQALAQHRDSALDRHEGHARLADGDLVPLDQEVAGDRLAVDQRPVATPGVDQHELAARKLERAVVARDRQVGQLHRAAFAASDRAAAHRDVELVAGVGSLDDHQPGQPHGAIVLRKSRPGVGCGA